MARVGLACLLVLAALAPAPAAARSVRDPDIGWPAARRQALHLSPVHSRVCHRQLTRAMVHLQGVVDKRGDPLEAIRAIMHYRWGNAWYDPCDGGRLGIGIQPAGARHVPAIRRLLAHRHLTRQTHLFAVRSTYRELSDAQAALDAQFGQLLDAGLMQSSSDTPRNAVLIELARPVSAEDRAKVRAAALASPVRVAVRDANADSLAVEVRR